MLSLTTCTVLFGLFLGLIATCTSRNNPDLNQIPAAHFTTPFSRLWLLLVRWRSTENRTRVNLHRRLGPVVRIGPQEVSVDCVEDGTRLIFSSKFAKDERLYGTFVHALPYLVTMLGNDEHKKRKRMLSHVYSRSHILHSQILDDTLLQTMNRLRKEMEGWASSGTYVDIMARCNACMIDITTGWLYGTEHGTNTLRDEVSRKKLFALLEPRLDGFFWRYEFRWLFKPLRWLGLDVTYKVAYDADRKRQQWFAQQNANAYAVHEGKPRPAASVYDYLYDHLRRSDPDMTHSSVNALITAELDDHLVAGYRVTAIAVMYAIYELSRESRIQRLLREELRTLNGPSDRPLALRIEDLPVLDAVVTETLRVWAPNPGPWTRVVPEPGCRLAGCYDVPAGTVVSSSSWTFHRNSTVFASPEEWRPERWLEADDASQKEMRKWMWAFGSGARICIGAHYAMRSKFERYFRILNGATGLIASLSTAFKQILVTIYTDFETLLDQSSVGNMDQIDGLVAGPVANRLDIGFRRLA